MRDANRVPTVELGQFRKRKGIAAVAAPELGRGKGEIGGAAPGPRRLQCDAEADHLRFRVALEEHVGVAEPYVLGFLGWTGVAQCTRHHDCIGKCEEGGDAHGGDDDDAQLEETVLVLLQSPDGNKDLGIFITCASTLPFLGLYTLPAGIHDESQDATLPRLWPDNVNNHLCLPCYEPVAPPHPHDDGPEHCDSLQPR